MLGSGERDIEQSQRIAVVLDTGEVLAQISVLAGRLVAVGSKAGVPSHGRCDVEHASTVLVGERVGGAGRRARFEAERHEHDRVLEPLGRMDGCDLHRKRVGVDPPHRGFAALVVVRDQFFEHPKCSRRIGGRAVQGLRHHLGEVIEVGEMAVAVALGEHGLEQAPARLLGVVERGQS